MPILTNRKVTEVKCRNCGLIYILGQTFNGKRCCDKPLTMTTGNMINVVDSRKTNDEEKQEVIADMKREDDYLQRVNSEDNGTIVTRSKKKGFFNIANNWS